MRRGSSPFTELIHPGFYASGELPVFLARKSDREAYIEEHSISPAYRCRIDGELAWGQLPFPAFAFHGPGTASIFQ